MLIALGYHDVLPDDTDKASGFSGPDAGTYKVRLRNFRLQMEALAALADVVEVRTWLERTNAEGTRPREWTSRQQVMLTFDDGGVSAHSEIAGELERFGWRGCFFITTRLIGQPGFLNTEQIRDLRRRGHVVGSHSASHQGRMSRMSRERLRAEWKESIDTLSGIIGEPVVTASVPSGFYSRQVAEEASEVGIRVLFTQEPTTKPTQVDSCQVLGRYTVRSWTRTATVAALAKGETRAQTVQRMLWQTRRLPKTIPGGAYSWTRALVFRCARPFTRTPPGRADSPPRQGIQTK